MVNLRLTRLSLLAWLVGLTTFAWSSGWADTTELLYDTEPNNEITQAVSLPSPGPKKPVKIIGELQGQDQDAYYWRIDEEDAGKRWTIRLNGRAGALTKLDVYDLTELVEGSAQGLAGLGSELEKKPPILGTLSSSDGAQPTIRQNVLLAPGDYVLGVSHSGGEGSYSVDISQSHSWSVTIPESGLTEAEPTPFSLRYGSATLGQGELWFTFDLDAEQAKQFWDLQAQTPLGIQTDLALQKADGTELVYIEAPGGKPHRRSGLSLEAGSYQIISRSEPLAVHIVSLLPGGAVAEDAEVEPNDTEAQGNFIELGQSINGQIEEGDTDWLAFSVNEEQIGATWQISLDTDNGEVADLCLYERSLRLSQCRRGKSITLNRLALPEGEYGLRVSPRGEPFAYELFWQDEGTLKIGEETEPNDTQEFPSTLSEKGFARGSFDGYETDIWRFSVTGESQLWRAQLQGDNLHEISILNGGGQGLSSQRAGSANRVRLDNLFLMPGEHFLKVSGTDSDYLIRVLPLGPPDPRMELEPNDTYQNAGLLPFGQERIGTMSESGDYDFYQFSLMGRERVRITTAPPADGSIRAELGVGDATAYVSEIRGGQKIGQPLVWELTLPPGDYSIQLSAGQTSDAEYSLNMERLGVFAAEIDVEPNNDIDHASPAPLSGRIKGHVGSTHGDVDWYQLPELPAETPISLPRLSGITVKLHADRNTDEDLLVWDAAAATYNAILAANSAYTIYIYGNAAYDYDLFGMGLDAAPPALTEVTLDAELNLPPEVQAYSSWGQSLTGQLTLSNTSASEFDIQLDHVLSDYRWQLALEQSNVNLQAGESLAVPFEITIPPDALADRSVRVAFQASTLLSGQTSTSLEIEASVEILPVNPVLHWSVPEAVRGGLNIAASALGAKPVASPGINDAKIDDIATLMDGLTAYGRWNGYGMASSNRQQADYAQPTIDLAGEEPMPVIGFLLNPTSEITSQRFLRNFAVALSVDGEHFNTVLEGQLEPVPEEQAFVLPDPVPARFARLIPKTVAFGKGTGVIKLGEFKVITTQESAAALLGEVNLADHANGGHLVWSEPWLRGNAQNTTLLSKDDKADYHKSQPDQPATAVLGFHHVRAAKLTGVAIHQLADRGSSPALESVRIFRSTSTPLGPWEVVGDWAIKSDSETIRFDSSVWARYLKFEVSGPEQGGQLYWPDQLQVFEAPASEDYRSILGEWGHYGSAGPLEAAQPPEWIGPASRPDNHSQEQALTLEAGKAVPGAALLDQYQAWYRLDVPADQNTINLVLRGQPTVQAAPELTDSNGEVIALYATKTDPDTHTWQAFVEPGKRYWLRVYEPPRSVIFSWDTSASVGWYLPSIANALNKYAEQIRPERDEVNLLPFGQEAPLLANWQGEPYPLRVMLNAYSHGTSSSDAEGALVAASKVLEGRPGKKAVLLVTDAATNTGANTWSAMESARPQIFAMSVSSEGALGPQPDVEQDLMQDWAQVNNGVYQYVTSLSALQRGFDRAIVRLRAPVTFEVQADYAFSEDPSPATVTVISGETEIDPQAHGAVELILDASGSMLKRMGGERRIQIAKAAITDVVKNVLPEGIPLALRVYGHKEAGSCRTDLEQTLAPLNKAQLLGKLESINAVNLAKTPIADSLKQVASDLADAEGQRWVILLTDGEETCEGDPAAAIEALAEQGIEVKLNIVGFAINDEALKTEFARWAQASGGRYFDATEAEALSTALNQALQIPYQVIDTAGETVAEGYLDGEPVQVPPGSYSIRLETSPARMFSDVQLAPGDQRELQTNEPNQ